MDANESSTQHAAEVLVDRGYQALRAGDRRRARHYFTTAISSDPACVTAWEGLARLTSDPHLALKYLHQAQALLAAQPGGRQDAHLRQAIGRIQSQIQQVEAAQRASPRTPPDLSPARLEPYPSPWRWVFVGLILLLLVMLIVVAALSLAPAISAQGLWPGEAVAMQQQPPRVETDRDTPLVASPATFSGRLAAGQTALAAEEWSRAVALLEAARRAEPNHQQAIAALVQGYLDWGRWQAAHGRYAAALLCFDRAQALAPDNLDVAGARLALSRERRSPAPGPQPPSPSPTVRPAAPQTTPRPAGSAGSPLTGKWIDINLSRQTLTAYEGSTPVLQAVVSTGTRRYPTPTGRFAIQRKYRYTHMSGPGYSLPNVPYAMFFYGGYAIHGTYWHDNFGTPMSHGCINMRTDQAGWLFNWAPVGTPVVIHN